jgi:hypothetical protein
MSPFLIFSKIFEEVAKNESSTFLPVLADASTYLELFNNFFHTLNHFLLRIYLLLQRKPV